jgi:hypothetical protein
VARYNTIIYWVPSSALYGTWTPCGSPWATMATGTVSVESLTIRVIVTETCSLSW